jgi:hypothetical protein
MKSLQPELNNINTILERLDSLDIIISNISNSIVDIEKRVVTIERIIGLDRTVISNLSNLSK